MNYIKNMTLAMSLMIGVVIGSPLAFAQNNFASVENEIMNNWEKNVPSFPEIDSIRPTPIEGLYEVVLGGEVVYTDQKVNYLFFGDIMDINGKKNLTSERRNELIAKVDFENLPLDNAIVLKRGNGERKLAVFEDPNCGFCHKFERDMLAIDDVTVYVFLYPILSDSSSAISTHILCAEDPQKSWEDWMLKKVTPAVATCDKADRVLTENLQLGKKYGVNSTPTLVFTDGSRILGAVPTENIIERFDELAVQ